ncbi:hypothetical protein PIROE2DRAFT_67749 [Piromyces sp. E2]|nr:hypothetical protein PIROE2DRAFT_67749 [Piromyces sp. E2]|eukprot:OUM58498.1 hypothetical protein PIROE2DRAFT_67749 [Piromyces sp. E2]
MVVIKNNLLSFTNEVNEWHIKRHHSLLVEMLESITATTPDENENEKETLKSMELMKEPKNIEENLKAKENFIETEKNPKNYCNNIKMIKTISSTADYYTATKSSNLISHTYDEDWYIRRFLPKKRNKGYWAANIYIY